MDVIVEVLGTGIGLVSEAIHHIRTRSSSPPGPLAPSYSASVGQLYQEVHMKDEATTKILIRIGSVESITFDPDKTNIDERGQPIEDSGSNDNPSASTESADDEIAWEPEDRAEQAALRSQRDCDVCEVASTHINPTIGGAEEPKQSKERGKLEIVRDIVRMAGPPPATRRPLGCLVVIPQRRPRNKHRGFARAYAPVLAESGISQEVFLKFLKDWHQASKAPAWIDVVFVAAIFVGFVPQVATQILSPVVQIVLGAAKELQTRKRRNTFLDLANEELFMPRGLYAMVMAFKDDPPETQGGPLSRLTSQLGRTLSTSQRLDIAQVAAKYSSPDHNMSKLKRGLKYIRQTNGKTYGETELLEAAELVYLDLNHASEGSLERVSEGREREGSRNVVKEKWRSTGKFVQRYLDYRAQATYSVEHPNSRLAVPLLGQKAYASRYSDPSHSVNDGSLVSLLTGGAINRGKCRQKSGRSAQDRISTELGGQESQGEEGRHPKRKGIISKIAQEDVLYLVIVNLPSDVEIERSVYYPENAEASIMGP
ncbi:hypothetical protein GGR51DRAFT_552739 [Nemania sp. FL0031]|nr:hypothetical protein GGR51DRAFT_552739 [Nemania sp. FL0031]